MNCKTLHFSRHAFERMFQRGISPNQARLIVESGKVISDYPNDKPYPSMLLLGFCENLPVHVLVAHNELSGDCHVVTVYRPAPELWDENYEKRRKT
jgi:hypothetical protein